MRQGVFMLLKWLAAGSLMSLVAGVFAVQLVSWKVKRGLAIYTPDEPESTELFFYDTIGSSPLMLSSLTRSAGLSETGMSSSLQPQANPSPLQFTVEVGYTRTQEGAGKVIDQLNVSGLPAFFAPVLRGSKRDYRISMGVYTSEQEAQEALTTLQHRTRYKGKVVPFTATDSTP